MRHHTFRSAVFSLFIGIGAVAGGAMMPAAAAPPRQAWDLKGLDALAADLPIGKNRAALIGWVKERIDRRYLPIIGKAHEFSEKERIRARREKEVAEFAASEFVFAGENTQWTSSIIGAEFGMDSGESVIIWREPEMTHFFFLAGGTFWKYARQLSFGETFEGRAEAWSIHIGKVAETGTENGNAVAYLWRGRGLDVRLVNRRVLYGGDLMVVQHPEIEKSLEPRRAEAAAKKGPKAATTTGIEEFLLDD